MPLNIHQAPQLQVCKVEIPAMVPCLTVVLGRQNQVKQPLHLPLELQLTTCTVFPTVMNH